MKKDKNNKEGLGRTGSGRVGVLFNKADRFLA